MLRSGFRQGGQALCTFGWVHSREAQARGSGNDVKDSGPWTDPCSDLATLATCNAQIDVRLMQGLPPQDDLDLLSIYTVIRPARCLCRGTYHSPPLEMHKWGVQWFGTSQRFPRFIPHCGPFRGDTDLRWETKCNVQARSGHP